MKKVLAVVVLFGFLFGVSFAQENNSTDLPVTGIPDPQAYRGLHLLAQQPTLIGTARDGRGIYGLSQSDTIPDAAKNVYPVKVGKKWGFVDQHGKTVHPATLNDFEGRSTLLNPSGGMKFFMYGLPLQTHSFHVHDKGNLLDQSPSEPLQKNPNVTIQGHPVQPVYMGAPVYNATFNLSSTAPRFDRVGAFQGGLAPALTNHRIYYIHPDGSIAFGGFKVAGTDMERDSYIMTNQLQRQINLRMMHDPPGEPVRP